MSRKALAPLGALVSAGVLVLSACGGTEQAAPPPASEEQTVDSGGIDLASAGVTLQPGTAKSNSAQPGTGDWAKGPDGTPNTAAKDKAQQWVEIKASRAGALDPVVVNGAGLTLYRFEKDKANPSKSTCNGECAATWPPVVVRQGSKVISSNVKNVGLVKRDDGSMQLTVKGWPVYRFNRDTKPGDTLGQGVGGTWFGITPDGGKANGGKTEAPAPSTGNNGGGTGGGEKKANRATLFEDKNFSESGFAQGVVGPGCVNVSRDVFSSIDVSGSVKLWSEPGCKGRSTVITGAVLDLAAINFDNDVDSLLFG
jgi:predicted lipoprotein with Yx(FWY)xxD motif